MNFFQATTAILLLPQPLISKPTPLYCYPLPHHGWGIFNFLPSPQAEEISHSANQHFFENLFSPSSKGGRGETMKNLFKRSVLSVRD